MCYIAVSTRWDELSSLVETVEKDGASAKLVTPPPSVDISASPSINVSSQRPLISPMDLSSHQLIARTSNLSSITMSIPSSSYHGILPAHLHHPSNTTTLDHHPQQPLSHLLSCTQPADTTSMPTHSTSHTSEPQQSEKRHSGNSSKRRWSSESAESQKAVSSSRKKVHRRTISTMEAEGE